MRNDHAEVPEQVARLADKRRTLAGQRLVGGALPGIGLAGPMGAGKDTTATAIADVLCHPSMAHIAGGRAVRRVAFADVLKREAYRQALTVKSILTLCQVTGCALDVERVVFGNEALCGAFMPAGAPIPGGLIGVYCQIFADALREGDTDAWDEDVFISVKTPAKRVAYQLLGQAVRRVDPGYWVRAAGCRAGGVAGIGLADGDSVIAFTAIPSSQVSDALVVSLSDAGGGLICEGAWKATSLAEFNVKGRGTGGMAVRVNRKRESDLLFAGVAVGEPESVAVADGDGGVTVGLPVEASTRSSSGGEFVPVASVPVAVGRM